MFLYVTLSTCSYEIWVVTKRLASQTQAAYVSSTG